MGLDNIRFRHSLQAEIVKDGVGGYALYQKITLIVAKQGEQVEVL